MNAMPVPSTPASRSLQEDYYQNNRPWLRFFLAPVSNAVRQRGFRRLLALVAPRPGDRVLDVGVTCEVDLPECNPLERAYPFPGRLVGLGIEHLGAVQGRFPESRFVQGSGVDLPFAADSFDVVFSNATIEHVGGRDAQERFLREALRVARRAIVVTPNRWFPIELHTFLPFVHYLPRPLHRRLLRRLGFHFYASEANLRLLGASDFRSMCPPGARVSIRYGPFGANVVAVAERIAPESGRG